jgi:hypothetical protein
MAKTKKTAREIVEAKPKAKKAEKTAREIVEAKPKAKKVEKPKCPGPAVLKRMALAAAPPGIDGPRVSASAVPHIKYLYYRSYNAVAPMPLEALMEENKRVEEKGLKKGVSNTLSFKYIFSVSEAYEDIEKDDLKKLTVCKNKDSLSEYPNCLLVSRAAFRKYLIMGSADGDLKAFYLPKLAPKMPTKKGAKKSKIPRGVGFRLPKDFLTALQWEIENDVVSSIRSAWRNVSGSRKTLEDRDFLEAGIEDPDVEIKEKKPRAKKTSGEEKPKKKAAAKKTKGKKKAEESKVKITTKVVAKRGRPKKS